MEVVDLDDNVDVLVIFLSEDVAGMLLGVGNRALVNHMILRHATFVGCMVT